MFRVGSVLQCVYAVLHSSGQAFPSTTSAGGEGLATVVVGGGAEGLDGHPNGS